MSSYLTIARQGARASSVVEQRAPASVVETPAPGTLHRSLVREHLLELGHADAGWVESELRTRGIAILDAAYGAQVSLTLGVTPADEPRLAAVLAELTSGAAETTVVGERWVDSLSP